MDTAKHVAIGRICRLTVKHAARRFRSGAGSGSDGAERRAATAIGDERVVSARSAGMPAKDAAKDGCATFGITVNRQMHPLRSGRVCRQRFFLGCRVLILPIARSAQRTLGPDLFKNPRLHSSKSHHQMINVGACLQAISRVKSPASRLLHFASLRLGEALVPALTSCQPPHRSKARFWPEAAPRWEAVHAHSRAYRSIGVARHQCNVLRYKASGTEAAFVTYSVTCLFLLQTACKPGCPGRLTATCRRRPRPIANSGSRAGPRHSCRCIACARSACP